MERAPLLTPIPSQFAEDELPLGPSSGGNERRARVAEVLESAELHWTVLGLTSIDALAVLSEIGWEFLKGLSLPSRYPILTLESQIQHVNIQVGAFTRANPRCYARHLR